MIRCRECEAILPNEFGFCPRCGSQLAGRRRSERRAPPDLGELREIAENAFENMEDREMAVRTLVKYACRGISQAWLS